jgi:hypothetical protein
LVFQEKLSLNLENLKFPVEFSVFLPKLVFFTNFRELGYKTLPKTQIYPNCNHTNPSIHVILRRNCKEGIATLATPNAQKAISGESTVESSPNVD